MSARPDLTATWVHRRTGDGRLEILLLRRAPDEVYPGIWQCVTGKLEPGETIVAGALRELEEEAGVGPADLEAFYETDQVNWFHVEGLDVLLCEAVFAARVRPSAVARISAEHDDSRWVSPDEARTLVPWPAYARAVDFVEWLEAFPAKAEGFRLSLGGRAPG